MVELLREKLLVHYVSHRLAKTFGVRADPGAESTTTTHSLVTGMAVSESPGRQCAGYGHGQLTAMVAAVG